MGVSTGARGDDPAELMSRLIHDVKNPLAAVLSFAEEIPSAPEAERREFCARLAVNARRALQVLDDFALLSALRQGCLELACAECDWPALVQEAIDEVVRHDPGSRARLVLVAAGAGTVRVDRACLSHALCSFLRETLRALRGGERLELTLGEEPAGMSLKVALSSGDQRFEAGLFNRAAVPVELLRRLALAQQGTLEVLVRPIPAVLLCLPR